VAAIAQFLHPAVWHGWFHASAVQLATASFWFAVLQIIFINCLLSGDNAVVIAMACRGLPPQQRRWGLVLGAGVAVILRIAFTGVIAQLMQLPYLKLVGGMALLYIAAKLLRPERADRNDVEAVNHLWRAIGVVVVADVVMSLDNVIAIAATANGNFLLLAIGLAVSIPIILAGAALVMALLERWPILIWAGAALLGWVAGDVIATDPVVVGHVAIAFGDKFAHHVELAAAGTGAMLAIAAGGLWGRLYETRRRAPLAGAKTRGA
jgi:YjbE family integral membrane protein